MEDKLKVKCVDHIHLYVSDQKDGAVWLERVLGMKEMKDFNEWENGYGPLMMKIEGCDTKIALFKGEPLHNNSVLQQTAIAFGTDGECFLKYIRTIRDLEFYDQNKRKLVAINVVDHNFAFSIYFNDPWGNGYEITTYDHDYVKEHL